MPNYTLTPTDIAALESFAQTLMLLRNTWGPKGLTKYRRPDRDAIHQMALPEPMPERLFLDARKYVLDDLGAGIDLRQEERRPLLAKIASGRAILLGYEPGPGLDKAQVQWMRCYRHLMTALLEVPIL